MVSHAEQSELIRDIGRADGYRYEPFTSAAVIDGNFKIMLPEALKHNPELNARFVGHIAAELADVDVIAAVGGAVDIAKEVVVETGMPLLELRTITTRGVKSFSLAEDDDAILAKKPHIGFFDDVSCTLRTVERAARQTGITGLIRKTLSGWRRGEPAPEGMTASDIMAHNRWFNGDNPYEIPLKSPVSSVIDRPIPLWLPDERAITMYLPEVAA